jgi:nitroreductase
MYECFFELVKQRRSIRKFLSEQIDDNKIGMILKAPLMAPTSKNSRSWEFVEVNDKTLLAQLAIARPQGSGLLAHAAAAIVVLADPVKSDAWLEDASIAAAFIQLQSEDLGLGSCWVQIARRPHDELQSAEQFVRGVLTIPDTLNVVCIIALGYKEEERRPHDTDKLPVEKIHVNRY